MTASLNYAAAHIFRELLHRAFRDCAEAPLTAERQHRHLELVVRPVLIVLRVVENRTIIFEARAQRAILRTASHVLVDVLFRNRGRIICGAIEEAQVDALAASHQRLGKIAYVVELNVPDAAATKRERL